MASSSEVMQARLLAMKQKVAAKEVPEVRGRKGKISEPTQRLYQEENLKWLNFKTIVGVEDLQPDLPTLMLLYQWYAPQTEGKLGKYSTISTLEWQVGRQACMHNIFYGYEIPKETIDGVRDYIRYELAEEIGLEDLSHDKIFASWTDIKILIHYIFTLDTHNYRQNRFMVQMVFLLLLFTASGERPGAVTRSEAYRDGNVALCYKDIELFIKPSVDPSSPPQFAMHITFNNRKGERKDAKKFLKITIDQGYDNLSAHCVVTMFKTLAFLDGAFADVVSPAELDSKRNLGSSNLPIPFKSSLKDIPILRRTQGIGGTELSPTLAWSAGSSLNDSQRIARAAGFQDRWTMYNIRRGVSNTIDGKIATAEKIQLMGHQNSQDEIYRRWYQSRHFTAPVQAIFQGQEPKSGGKELLSMHWRRDASAPSEIPEAMKESLYTADQTIQELSESRHILDADLRRARSLDDKAAITMIKEKRGKVRRKLCGRKQVICRQNLKTFRQQWFEERASNILQSQGQQGPENPAQRSSIPEATMSPERQAVIDAVYAEEDPTLRTHVNALESLIQYCRSNLKSTGSLKGSAEPEQESSGRPVISPSRQPASMDSSVAMSSCLMAHAPPAPGPFSLIAQAPFRTLNTTNLPSIATVSTINSQRTQKLEKHPTKSKARRIRKSQVSRAGDHLLSNQHCRDWTLPELQVLRTNSERLTAPKHIDDMEWQRISCLLPGRTRRSIIDKAYRVQKFENPDKFRKISTNHIWFWMELGHVENIRLRFEDLSKLDSHHWDMIQHLLPHRSVKAITQK